MTEPTLTCPTCRTQIKLTESLAAPLIEVTRRRYEDQLARKEAEVAGREAAIRDKQAQIAAARETIDAQVAAKVDEERGRIAATEAQKAQRLVAIDVDAKVKEIADLNQVLKQRDAKLAEAQQAQADLIRKQRELDDAKREIELTIQKQVQAELGTVRDQAKLEAEAALTLRVREKEEQIASMQRQIEDLRRKAEQGSQQLQGEVQELALEALLRQKFPRDVFEPVPKGDFGGDLIQRVVGPAGQVCGSILWEAKRTKNWADGWLGKVREDQRAAKADIILFTSAEVRPMTDRIPAAAKIAARSKPGARSAAHRADTSLPVAVTPYPLNSSAMLGVMPFAATMSSLPPVGLPVRSFATPRPNSDDACRGLYFTADS